MSQRRRRFKQSYSLEERLVEEAKRLREEAKLLPPGAIREEVLRRAGQCETGAQVSDWLRSPGQSPKAGTRLVQEIVRSRLLK